MRWCGSIPAGGSGRPSTADRGTAWPPAPSRLLPPPRRPLRPLLGSLEGLALPSALWSPPDLWPGPLDGDRHLSPAADGARTPRVTPGRGLAPAATPGPSPPAPAGPPRAGERRPRRADPRLEQG